MHTPRHWLVAVSLLAIGSAVVYPTVKPLFSAPTQMAAPAAAAPAARSLSLFLLGASGRTGIPFLHRALERGHKVTAYVRDAKKLPKDLTANPLLTCVEAQLDDQAALNAAIARARPAVLLSMLASDQKPHTGMSNGAKGIIAGVKANRAAPAAAAAGEAKGDGAAAPAAPVFSSPPPLILIGGWGAGGPSEAMVAQSNIFNRAIIGTFKLFMKQVVADFQLGVSTVEQAKQEGVLRAMWIQPPLLTNGPFTGKYDAGTPAELQKRMSTWDTISRADIADLALKLAERAGEGEELPEFIGIRNP
jgi:hypothetical protein